MCATLNSSGVPCARNMNSASIGKKPFFTCMLLVLVSYLLIASTLLMHYMVQGAPETTCLLTFHKCVAYTMRDKRVV